MEQERSEHESFGQISISRVSCNPPARFYGSELPQDHYMTLEIHNSELVRDLSQDRHYATGIPLIKIRMSSGQFSEMITSLNVGSGVPCTIERLIGKKVCELPDVESRKEVVHRSFKDRMKMFADKIRTNQQKAKELVNKKTLTKAEMHELQLQIDWLTTEIEKNIPFFSECFQESIDEMVFEAKTEVENAIQHKISVLGLTELHKQNRLLSEGQ